MNPAEEIVYRLCQRSFLSLWSYANPRQKINGKELCDVIVVCDPDVIIFSVKHVTLPKNGPSQVNVARWYRRAIDASVAQLYGAERALKKLSRVVKSDNSYGIELPKIDDAHIHRVAIALGGQGVLGMPYGEFGKGFVHVLDEAATTILLDELDTITDFVGYLRDKEHFLRSTELVCEGEEADLLAIYLNEGRQLPSGRNLALIGDDTWEIFKSKQEYRNKKIADKESYAWDRLIEIVCKDVLAGDMVNPLSDAGSPPSPSAEERCLRVMARESRFCRRVLGKSWAEFLAGSHQIRSRQVRSPSGVVYIFLATPHGFARNVRAAELGNRCFVALGQNRQATVAIGVATEQYTPGMGYSLDLCHTYKPVWTQADQEAMEGMQRDLGYFVNPRKTRTREDEYPSEPIS